MLVRDQDRRRSSELPDRERFKLGWYQRRQLVKLELFEVFGRADMLHDPRSLLLDLERIDCI